ncbi:MAG: LuxR C-terminal-related transcriptional regulator [Deltaproteobacteria bacterium]
MSSLAFCAVLHALDLEEPAWIEALFEEGRSLFDEGQGLFVYSYRVGTRPALRLGALAGEHTAPRVWQMLSSWGNKHARVLARTYITQAGGVEARSGGLRAPLRDLRSELEAHAIADILTILAHDPNGFGVFLTAPRPRRLRLDARQCRSRERLATELGAALRLREARRRVDLVRLSASERTVIRLLASGASDKDIALALGVGLSSVSTFARRARTKLRCRPGTEALLLTEPGSERRQRELFAQLTASECDVAADLLLGRSYAEIALRRSSSPRTVAAQSSLIFRKCGVAGRRALAAAMLGGTATSGK